MERLAKKLISDNKKLVTDVSNVTFKGSELPAGMNLADQVMGTFNDGIILAIIRRGPPTKEMNGQVYGDVRTACSQIF
jgi:hypothetical protein